ncbi:MAG: hypothetical protein IJM62_07530 [Lachnospiraceae bacterium]|nr:hypothetical protein [Lachnospiraceae bacterium]
MAVLTYTFYRDLWWMLFLMPAGAFIYLQECRRAEAERRREFRRGFRDALRALKGRIASGASLENAFSLTLEDLGAVYDGRAPIMEAFSEICRLQSLNIPASDCLYRTAVKYGDSDMIGFARIVGTVSAEGGRITEIIQRSTDRITEKIDMEEGLETAIAGKKNEFSIMKAVPVLILIYMGAFNRDLTEVLYTTAAGRIVMTACLIVYLTACRWGGRISEMRV